MTPTPTGRFQDRDGTPYLVFERSFRAPIADVWAAVTESDRLARWIGVWTGDPAQGQVTFRMTAEGPDVPEEQILVEECDEPTHLLLRSSEPGGSERLWTWRVDLSESAGVTTLLFAQEVTDLTLAESVGPGWDYYLDRLVAVESGADLAAIDFADYHPAFAEHYRRELA